jgi:drug/metabolite transporter superfamily protein YnfA
MTFLKDLWDFIKQRNKWWLLPVIIALLIIGILITLAQTSVFAPFIYTLF